MARHAYKPRYNCNLHSPNDRLSRLSGKLRRKGRADRVDALRWILVTLFQHGKARIQDEPFNAEGNPSQIRAFACI